MIPVFAPLDKPLLSDPVFWASFVAVGGAVVPVVTLVPVVVDMLVPVFVLDLVLVLEADVVVDLVDAAAINCDSETLSGVLESEQALLIVL
jgi:hypothetical protein